MRCDDMIYLLTAIGLTPGGSSTVHIYQQTIHRTTQSTKTIIVHVHMNIILMHVHVTIFSVESY